MHRLAQRPIIDSRGSRDREVPAPVPARDADEREIFRTPQGYTTTYADRRPDEREPLPANPT